MGGPIVKRIAQDNSNQADGQGRQQIIPEANPSFQPNDHRIRNKIEETIQNRMFCKNNEADHDDKIRQPNLIEKMHIHPFDYGY